ncbi:ABC transporter ATP-binding protein [Spongiactinospora rosea]|uniref:ABC transporter ATP-binding protein n=1 Tax=Spongiactinospora rosea TaxID=2248750 RepID=A0A366LZ19_9ACTN|nr:ABC transporter ATP-binding protein [Spongiactinospora rosea]RBQ19171.1 ABC transporter ATP-binding protein [Spongiactinospora rosea]
MRDGPGDIVLDVDDLHVSYARSRDLIQAVQGVSFRVRRGERLAVIGESGAGKSTIAGTLLGLLPGNAVIGPGTARFGDLDLTAIRSERVWNGIRGGAIALIPQDPNIALDPVKRVGYQIDETVRLHGRPGDRREPRGRSIELLGQAGLPDADRVYDAYPHQLSGGQRQRALIAIALGGEPELIIADEPTSGLDVTVQKPILDLLDDLASTRGLSIILITHDLAVAGQRTDSVMVLQDGRVVDRGPTADVLTAPAHPYTRRLSEAVPGRFAGRLTATSPRPARDRPAAEHLVSVRGLDKSYVSHGARSGRTVQHAVRDVSFSIAEGTTYGLVGESGSGKSTIARIVAGIDRPDRGVIAYRGRDVLPASRAERRRLNRAVQYVFQNPYSSLDPRLDVAATVTEPLHGFKVGARSERLDRAAEALAAVGLDGTFLRRKPGELSGGQRQRVALARAVALRPELIVLDEPTSALDVSVQAQVLRLLVNLQHEFGLTYLFISHDLGVIRLLADRVGVLDGGALVEEAPVEQIFTSPRQDYTRRLIDAIPRSTPDRVR